MAKSNWERDFPALFQFGKDPLASTKSLINCFLLKYEKAVRWIIFLGTCFLMLYIIDQFLNLGIKPTEVEIESVEKNTIQIYQLYRNYFYLLWVISIIPLSALSIIYWIKKGFSRFLRLFLVWLGILLFVTFSYAGARLISNIIRIPLLTHQTIIGSKN